jgi:hypothetical protein
MQRGKVEVTTRYVTVVDHLGEAWTFVMDNLDKVGPDPRVTISPCWVTQWDGIGEAPPTSRTFEVMVEGMVEQ